MTAKEYIDSLREMKTRVYMFGEKIDNWVDHPMIRPSINCVAMTYALAQDPQYADLMTVTSSLTGHTVNRFSRLHQSTEDLVKKVKMQRLLGQKTASCFQRCVDMDAFNAVYSTIFEIDEAHGTGYHRQSYGGGKVGVSDVVIGAAAIADEYNGVEKASAVKDKLIEMTHLNETLYACSIACSCEGCPTKAGNYQIDLLLANVCKQNATRFPYEIVRLAEDIAGGLMVTMPSQKDFESDMVVGSDGETIGDICNKYFAAREGVSPEDRQRIMRFLENICLGSAAVGYRTESLHGAGSPQAQRIMIGRQGNIQGKKQLAKNIAGIK